jgi:serine/threonine protein kinase
MVRGHVHGAAKQAPPFKAGHVLAGRYRIERVLGYGGMGVVYAAHHVLLDQRVAVKILYGDALAHETKMRRFLFEAQAAARLETEHVARVLDVSVEDDVPFIVMEYLDGTDLSRLLEEQYQPMDAALVVDYTLQACEALAHAHAEGIVHRDVKPSNLFLATRPDGTRILKVLDFGFSKAMSSDLALTCSHDVMGDGAPALDNTSNGAGGGGAGGAVVVRATGSVSCASITARGGRGGNTSGREGPGGGGGGGRVLIEATSRVCPVDVAGGGAGLLRGATFGALAGSTGTSD